MKLHLVQSVALTSLLFRHLSPTVLPCKCHASAITYGSVWDVVCNIAIRKSAGEPTTLKSIPRKRRSWYISARGNSQSNDTDTRKREMEVGRQERLTTQGGEGRLI
ncbi:hypothetical protein EDB83DRAFT_932569 [Lactarius deliciosus]|nr:hypothetical protein EDB83DRAFT_932569 [Lactarius deliciosus]